MMAAGNPPVAVLLAASSWYLWLGAAMVIAAPLAAIAFVVASRPATITLQPGAPDVGTSSSESGLGLLALLTLLTEKRLKQDNRSRKIDSHLEQADLSIRASEFVVFTALVALLPSLAMLALGMTFSALAVICGVPILAWTGVKRRGRKRRDLIQDQLPDTVMTMASSLRSGSSPLQAILVVAEKAPNPTAQEFQRVVTESRLGRPLVDSIRDLARRVGSEDIEWLAEAIAMNEEIGGNLSKTLDNVGETVTARAEVRSQVRIMSAEGRLTATILISLPFVICGLLQLMNPEFIDPLLNTSTGNVLLGVAVGLMAVGAFWVNRLIQLEY